MASKNTASIINRLPIKITIDKEDLESDEDVPVPTISKGVQEKKTRYSRIELASQMKTGMDDVPLYIDVIPQRQQPSRKPIAGAETETPNVVRGWTVSSNVDSVMDKSVFTPGFEKLESVPPYTENKKRLKAKRKEEASKTKGDKWFNLPAPEMTEEKQRDLEVIQMRSILNPKQFYKKNDLKVLPKYFQVGTVVDSPADFYHGRVAKKDRKKTLVDELMADANFQRYNKRKYADIIQAKPKSSGPPRNSRRLKKKKKE
uniref:EOG090X0GO7 n=1 Tax=Alona affinis TaxID=381656 RepID=A0A9N6ZEQ2_9CRUS|nr:EOG090X0GO7 [Alona affinis]